MKSKILLLITVLLFTLTGCEKPDDTPEEQDTNLYTNYTDSLEMDFTYDGKDFLADGVGEVTLDRCTDGDTAQFSDGSTHFAVRFLGIDTPESTYRIDPWGKAASTYTCDKLTNATTIVLESDGDRTDGNERYLAWVWYDGRLLNLELVEQAYSNAKGTSDTKYENIIYDAELTTQLTDRRIWGESDPTYDYSLEGAQITIKELATNSAEYEGIKIVLTGIVAAEVGNHPFIVDDEGYGIYLYLGYDNSVYIEPGNEVRIEGLTLTFYPDIDTGSPQLTGFYKRNLVLISENNVVTPRNIEVKDLVPSDLGSYVTVENLIVTDVYLSGNTGDYTVTCEDALGNSIGLHITGTVDQTVFNNTLFEGSVIDVTAPLSRYLGQYQLEMSNIDSVVKK